MMAHLHAIARTPSRVASSSRSVAHTPNRRTSASSEISTSTTVNEKEVSKKIMTAMERLNDEQKKLQAISSRIEEKLNEAVQLKTQSQVSKVKLPRELSATVREVYAELKEEGELTWDFTVSFDDPANKEFNKTLIKNVQAVISQNDEERMNISMIKRAVRTYFKTKKSRHQRVSNGKQAANASEARKRQRRHNKAHARLRALKLSKTIDETIKQKVEPVLKADYMSSEESVVGDDEERDGTGSSSGDEDTSKDTEARRGHKKLIRHKIPWRSREFQQILESLDRKIDRRRSARSKAMCLSIEIGGDSSREKPDTLPEWASELFC